VRSQARYDEIAELYDEMVGDDTSDAVSAALFDLVPDPRGLRLLDLACGQGRISRELARRGAVIVGADVSAALLERARALEERRPLGIAYVHADAMSPDALQGEVFKGVVCHFGLSDIPDLGATCATVRRVTEPGAWFVFAILHPCFAGWGDNAPSSWPTDATYYNEGWWLASNTGLRGKVGATHRTLSTYLNTLVEHDLAVERLGEPKPGSEWPAARGLPSGPVYLVVRCRRL